MKMKKSEVTRTVMSVSTGGASPLVKRHSAGDVTHSLSPLAAQQSIGASARHGERAWGARIGWNKKHFPTLLKTFSTRPTDMDTIIFSMLLLHTAFGSAGAQYTPGECLKIHLQRGASKSLCGCCCECVRTFMCGTSTYLHHTRSCMGPDGS